MVLVTATGHEVLTLGARDRATRTGTAS